jgi:dephospho-CoA kinase
VNVIGLTGGIGSGKTTVAGRFEALGAAIVDTDEISRSLTGAGGAALAMRSLAFEDPGARARLEAVLHPAIRAAADSALGAARGPYAIIVVPLLFEARGYLDRVSRVLVVDCPEETQLARTMQRSRLAPEAVRAIMAAQWPRWRRLQSADDVVWNGGELRNLDGQCERLHGFYCTIAPKLRRVP